MSHTTAYTYSCFCILDHCKWHRYPPGYQYQKPWVHPRHLFDIQLISSLLVFPSQCISDCSHPLHPYFHSHNWVVSPMDHYNDLLTTFPASSPIHPPTIIHRNIGKYKTDHRTSVFRILFRFFIAYKISPHLPCLLPQDVHNLILYFTSLILHPSLSYL